VLCGGRRCEIHAAEGGPGIAPAIPLGCRGDGLQPVPSGEEESADPSVSLDLIIRSLLALGASRQDIAKAISRRSVLPAIYEAASSSTRAGSWHIPRCNARRRASVLSSRCCNPTDENEEYPGGVEVGEVGEMKQGGLVTKQSTVRTRSRCSVESMLALQNRMYEIGKLQQAARDRALGHRPLGG
jgi:hypothetical protein